MWELVSKIEDLVAGYNELLGPLSGQRPLTPFSKRPKEYVSLLVGNHTRKDTIGDMEPPKAGIALEI
jgi:hypothetical protein